MKTPQDYLSGQHDEELRVLVGETRGWRWHGIESAPREPNMFYWKSKIENVSYSNLPHYPTSLDACRELLEDLTEFDEQEDFAMALEDILETFGVYNDPENTWKLLRATARQICAAWLIVKGILK